jgi:hypothetical protein
MRFPSFVPGAVLAMALLAAWNVIEGHAQAPAPRPAASAAAAGPGQASPTPVAQSARARAAARTFAPRTPWGDPDLQGSYTTTNENGVPMERPNQYPAQGNMSEAEFQKIVRTQQERNRASAGRIGGAATGAGPEHWYEHLDAAPTQLWMLSEPADGKLPPLTADGQRRLKARAPRVTEPSRFEQFTLYDRCITRGLIGSILPVIYGNSLDITQGPGVVAIRNEMIHETRVIPLDGRPRPDASIRNYMGVSRGRWEGTILVVETTNFTDLTQIGINGSGNVHSAAMKVTERFIPVDGKTMRWEVTVDDPQTYTQPWTFGLPLTRDASQEVVEYACHEGNYAIRNMLTGAAAQGR